MEKYLDIRKKQKVTTESLIRFKGKAYSVDPDYINCEIEIEEKNNTIYLYHKEKLVEIYEKDSYNQKINYKKEHYEKALARSYGENVKTEDIENKALENLKRLDMVGGIKNEIQ